MTGEEEFIHKIFPYLPEHNDDLVTYSISDEELKAMGRFGSYRNETYVNRRKARREHYIEDEANTLTEDFDSADIDRGNF